MSEILFADDDAAMREMVAAVLRSAGYRVRLVTDGASALTDVRRTPPDLVLLDFRMGSPNGLEVCERIKADPRLEHLPVLMLTGQGALEDRVRGFEAGADDYLAKPFDARELLARIRALLRLSRQGLDRNPTSGLPGGEAIEREFRRRHAQSRNFTICYFDLDNFKPFGDRFGFSVADEVIREVGSVLRDVTDGTDAFVGHVGGDDFILFSAPEEGRRIAEAAQRLFRQRLVRHLPAEVAERGTYVGVDRTGAMREIPLTRMAVAVVHIEPVAWQSLAQLGEAVAEVKRRAKAAEESGIAEVELLSPHDPGEPA